MLLWDPKPVTGPLLRTHLQLGLPSGSLPLRILDHYCFLISHIRATCSTYLILLDLIIVVIFGADYYVVVCLFYYFFRLRFKCSPQ